MAQAVESVCLVVREGQDRAGALGREIGRWLDGRGISWRLVVNRPEGGGICPPEPSAAPGPAGDAGKPDLYLVLGGDGTFISVARQTLVQDVPLFGINLGRHGFLAEATPGEWRADLENILEKGPRVEARVAIDFSVRRNQDTVHRGVLVNDLVINRGTMARLIRVVLASGRERVNVLRADGLIVATPTGSTAYAASAGGPLVQPELGVFCVVPICPFMSNSRPLVLDAATPLSVEVQEPVSEVFLTEDGQKLFPLRTGDRVVMRRAAHDLLVVRREGVSYFDTLHEKGYLTESAR
jgi:NAD+ kinase